MKLYILGDSHVRALGSSFTNLRSDARRRLLDIGGFESFSFAQLLSFPAAVRKFYEVDGDSVRLLDEAARAALLKAAGTDFIDGQFRDAVVALSMATTTTLFIRSPVWSAYSPCRVRAHGGGYSLSDAVIRAMASSHYTWIIHFHKVLRQLGLRIVSIGAPPPRLDDLSIARGVHPEVVLEVDRLARSVMAAELLDLGIDIVPAPEACYTGNHRSGFLKDEYASKIVNVVHHANADFGRLMLEDVVRVAATLRKP